MVSRDAVYGVAARRANRPDGGCRTLGGGNGESAPGHHLHALEEIARADGDRAALVDAGFDGTADGQVQVVAASRSWSGPDTSSSTLPRTGMVLFLSATPWQRPRTRGNPFCSPRPAWWGRPSCVRGRALGGTARNSRVFSAQVVHRAGWGCAKLPLLSLLKESILRSSLGRPCGDWGERSK